MRAFREIPARPPTRRRWPPSLRQALKGLARRASVRRVGPAQQPSGAALAAGGARRPSKPWPAGRRGAAPGGLPTPPLADAVVCGRAVRDGRRQTGYARRVRRRVCAPGCSRSSTPASAIESVVDARRSRTPRSSGSAGPSLPDAVVAVLSVNAHATAITVVHGGVVLFARGAAVGRPDRPRGRRPGRAPAGSAFASRMARQNLGGRWSTCASSQKVDASRVLVCGDLFRPAVA
ncbi:MAG: hypothetical protein MZW92_09495 [Comamonadaceae bacterium]|nr:hypothetical protein [Comamonadaceae bacterium]